MIFAVGMTYVALTLCEFFTLIFLCKQLLSLSPETTSVLICSRTGLKH